MGVTELSSGERPNAILGLHHLAIQVHDLEASVRWYRELFELPVLREWLDERGALRSVWLRLSNEVFLALERCSERPEATLWRHSSPGYHVAALRIAPDERRHWEERLSGRGIAIDHRSRWTLYFRDPEGNRLGLSHHPDDDPEA